MDQIHARTLGTRAARLRRLARQAPDPLAQAYLRRACELEFLCAVYAPRSDVTTVRSPVAA
jgi:hypothetical protein